MGSRASPLPIFPHLDLPHPELLVASPSALLLIRRERCTRSEISARLSTNPFPSVRLMLMEPSAILFSEPSSASKQAKLSSGAQQVLGSSSVGSSTPLACQPTR